MRKACYFASFLVLYGCGGGGDSSTNNGPTATANSVPNPTLTLTTDKNFVRVGDTLTVMWESTNANACVASGSWTGSKAKSGSETFVVKVAGLNNYTVECSSNNSSVKQSKEVVVPYPVYATSYENKNNIDFHETQVPTIKSLGIKVDSDEQDSNERSITFADFFQEGKVSAFVVVNRHKNVYGVKNLSDSPAKSYFLSKNSNGVWVDRTTELIKNSDDRYTCVSVSYSITADFNNDKVPDVFLACNGIDYDLGNGTMISTHPEYSKTYLANPVLYLSNNDKTYRKITLPYRMYAHQAAAADINKDGAVDLVITNQVGAYDRLPVVLLGNGDGSFIKNNSLLPNDMLNKNINGLYQVQIIPIENRLDIIFGYADESVYIKGFQNGGFDHTSWTTILMPVSKTTNRRYEMPLDVIYKNNSFYFSTNSATSDKTEWVIVKTNLVGNNVEVIPTFTNTSGNLQPYSAQIKPDNQGQFVAYTGGCAKTITLGMCGMRVKY